jgi:trigger factor
LQTTITESGPFERVLTITIENDALDDAKKEAARRLSKDMKVKGFRPGKVPYKVVEATVGDEVLRQEAIEVALPRIVTEALVEAELSPATAPAIADTRDNEDGVEVDVKVTLWPTLDRIPIYEGRKVSVSSPEVTDEELEAQIDRLRDQYAELEDVSRPIAEDDYAVVNLTATHNTKELEDLSAADLTYPVGSRSFLPGLDEHLVGESAGSIVKYNETLPETFGEYANREVTFTVLVKGVKQKKLPELTDEWVDEVSEFETIAELLENLTDGIADLKTAASLRQLRDQILADMVEDMDLEMPEALVGAEMEFQLHRFLHRLEQQEIGLGDYLRVTGQDEQGFIDDVRLQAIRSLSTRILLDALAEKEGIAVDEEELQTTLEQLAAAAGESKEDYAKRLEEAGGAEALTGDILRSKVIDHLVEAAVPVDENGNELSLQAALAAPAADGDPEEE